MKQDNTFITKVWEILEQSIIYYYDRPIGTVAACDRDTPALNYDQCFVRDFVPAALLFLIKGKTEIVRNFLTYTLKLQIKERQLDFLEPRRGLMPASFKVIHQQDEQYLQADFGDHAIGRVTPVDSCLWWMFLLRAYIKATEEYSLAHSPEMQKGIRLIMELCLSARFDMYPTLLVPDGACMIDRRMGINGHPLEIQALFYTSLRCAKELLIDNLENEKTHLAINNRLSPLLGHIRYHYWLDLERLNVIYRYKSEEYGENVLNQFNIYPESIPYAELSEWLPEDGGYLVGNLGPSQLDCRFFSLGNLMAIISSLASEEQANAILNTIERKWPDLIGFMPMKICFPALKDRDWHLLTGCDPKNRPWSYHNGGNWPALLWQLVGACLKNNRPNIGRKALNIAAKSLVKDEWAEYYDGKNGRLVGKEARKYQIWTIASYLLAEELMADSQYLKWISYEEL